MIDLGGSNDSLTLAATGPNSLTITNVETLVAGAGNDTVTLGAAAVGATYNLAGGTDTLQLSGTGNNNVTVNAIETVLGGSSDDTITMVLSTIGATLNGGGGDDTLVSSNGADTLIGGSGADYFVFRDTAQSSATVFDTITDFVVGQDKLVFEGLGNGNFSMVSTFTNTGDAQAKWDSATNILLVDTDGNGVAEMKLTLVAATSDGLSASDFQWT